MTSRAKLRERDNRPERVASGSRNGKGERLRSPLDPCQRRGHDGSDEPVRVGFHLFGGCPLQPQGVVVSEPPVRRSIPGHNQMLMPFRDSFSVILSAFRLV